MLPLVIQGTYKGTSAIGEAIEEEPSVKIILTVATNMALVQPEVSLRY